MKYIFFLFFLLPIFGFNQDDTFESISKAFGNGNATILGSYMEDNVELTILDKGSVYTKSEAIKQVNAFFANNKPEGFSQMHQGTSKGAGAKYCIGNLKTNAKTYRVYIFLSPNGNTYKIQELRIEA